MLKSTRSPLHQAHSSPHSDDEEESDEEVVTSSLQDLSLQEVIIDVQQLNPLSPEVISKQATINIGTLLS